MSETVTRIFFRTEHARSTLTFTDKALALECGKRLQEANVDITDWHQYVVTEDLDDLDELIEEMFTPSCVSCDRPMENPGKDFMCPECWLDCSTGHREWPEQRRAK